MKYACVVHRAALTWGMRMLLPDFDKVFGSLPADCLHGGSCRSQPHW